jgi:hypothetical protein
MTPSSSPSHLRPRLAVGKKRARGRRMRTDDPRATPSAHTPRGLPRRASACRRSDCPSDTATRRRERLPAPAPRRLERQCDRPPAGDGSGQRRRPRGRLAVPRASRAVTVAGAAAQERRLQPAQAVGSERDQTSRSRVSTAPLSRGCPVNTCRRGRGTVRMPATVPLSCRGRRGGSPLRGSANGPGGVVPARVPFSFLRGSRRSRPGTLSLKPGIPLVRLAADNGVVGGRVRFGWCGHLRGRFRPLRWRFGGGEAS